MDLNGVSQGVAKRKLKRRVGRGVGSGQGKTAGKGHKGQKARSGGGIPAWFEGGQMPLHRRVPKRGFHNPFRVEYAVVNVGDLATKFPAGTVVTPDLLREVRLVKGKKKIKVLAHGEISVALTVKAHKFSGKAAERIAAAGGSVETL